MTFGLLALDLAYPIVLTFHPGLEVIIPTSAPILHSVGHIK